MKKYITKISVLTFAFLGIFAFTPNLLALNVAPVMVMNATAHPNSDFGQYGSTSTYANAGDTISVQIFYNNETSSSVPVTLSLSPRTQGPSNTFTFSGGASNGSQGSANIILSGNAQTLTLISGSARWYKDAPSYGNCPNCTKTPVSINSDSLFNGSLSVGTLAPAQGGVSPNQGVVVVDFLISNNQAQNNNYNQNNNYTPPAQNVIYGCMNGGAYNYNYLANREDGSCLFNNTNNNNYNNYNNNYNNIVYGCTNSGAYNYSRIANRDDGSCRYSNNSQVISGNTPSVATTIATEIIPTSARVNGIAYANGNNTNTWFEWGVTTGLGSTTPTRSIGTTNGAQMSEVITGLQTGTIYFYRSVAQNQYGTVYGDRLSFRTSDSGNNNVNTNTTTETRIVYVHDSQKTANLIPSLSVPSLLALRIDNKNENACSGDNLDYNFTYQNVSAKTINNVILQIILPSEISFAHSSAGSFDKDTNTITVNIGTLSPNQTGSMTVSGTMGTIAQGKDIVVVTGRMAYTHPTSGAQEEAIAYSITHPSTCRNNNGLGAAALFGTGFYPTTLFGWLLLILVILLLVFIAREVYTRARNK